MLFNLEEDTYKGYRQSICKAVSYVKMETSREHTSLDWNNSIFL